MNATGTGRDGDSALDAGLRYDASERWSLMLQANLVLKGRDRGSEAEPEDTGGESLWIGPGASYAVSKDVQAVRLRAAAAVPVRQRRADHRAQDGRAGR